MYDVMIIGQGLAGTLLSYHYLKQGKRPIVLNRTDAGSASHVAAGLCSPITGQRITKIENADQSIFYAHQLYHELEVFLEHRFFYALPHIKIATTDRMSWYMEKRIHDPAYQPFLSATSYTYNGQNTKAVQIHHSGYLNIPLMLTLYRQKLIDLTLYQEVTFHADQLIVHADCVAYGSIKAHKVVFCNGIEASNNQFFSHLQFKPTKGQLITITMQKQIDMIVNGNIFLLPIGGNLYHVGATYEHQFTDNLPTQEGLNWLTNELQSIIGDEPYQIVHHQAGIRPTTVHHKPFTEWHVKHPHVGIFSGFGSRGVSTIGYMAKTFM